MTRLIKILIIATVIILLCGCTDSQTKDSYYYREIRIGPPYPSLLYKENKWKKLKDYYCYFLF